jgi:hypothetical protein
MKTRFYPSIVAALGLFCAATRAQPPKPESIPPGFDFPAAASVLLRMRDVVDVPAMRRHAWLLFAGMTRPAHGGGPIWETWYPVEDVYPIARPANSFEPSQQFLLAKELDPKLPGSGVLSRIRFNSVAADHIRTNGLNDKNTLKKMLDDQEGIYPATTVPAFPADAIATKTAWALVHQPDSTLGAADFTAVPVWDPPPGPLKTANDPGSWPRCVAVDPRDGQEGRTARIPCHPGKDPRLGPWTVIDLKRFYHVVLDASMAAQVGQMIQDRSVDTSDRLRPPRVGDFLVLVGLHVTTKEIPDWVWATFWWHDRPDVGPFAAGRPPHVRGYWRNYLMDTTLSMETALESDGNPKICFNPWIEAGQSRGVVANCMACHSRATYPPPADVNKFVRGRPDPVKSENNAALGADFLWSIGLRNGLPN